MVEFRGGLLSLSTSREEDANDEEGGPLLEGWWFEGKREVFCPLRRVDETPVDWGLGFADEVELEEKEHMTDGSLELLLARFSRNNG